MPTKRAFKALTLALLSSVVVTKLCEGQISNPLLSNTSVP